MPASAMRSLAASAALRVASSSRRRASILAAPVWVTKFGCGLIGRSGSVSTVSVSASRTKALLMAGYRSEGEPIVRRRQPPAAASCRSDGADNSPRRRRSPRRALQTKRAIHLRIGRARRRRHRRQSGRLGGAAGIAGAIERVKTGARVVDALIGFRLGGGHYLG